MKRKFRFLSVIMISIMWLAALVVNANAQEKINERPAKESEKVNKLDKPYEDGFFEIARLIMTKEEKEIYKHLADKNAKLQFIEEFWKKRDPTPETEENESMDEFLLRVAFANKHFKEYSQGRGWDTERGRILLQLGFPDKRDFGDYAPTSRGQLLTSKRSRVEVWVYYRYHLVLYFQGEDDAASRLRLTRIPTELSYALDRVKYSMNLISKSDVKQSFKFDVDYKPEQFEVAIPIDKVSFAEGTENRMIADFQITVYVYKDNEKFDEVSIPKTVSIEKDKLLNMKSLEFNVPYSVKEKGKYLFDVVIEEKSTSEKFREMTKFKI